MVNLPTQAEVNAATRHAASFAGGVIVAFGLGTKIDPQVVQNLITTTGALANDAFLLIGLVTPLVAGYFAKRSATPDSQAAATAVNAAAKTLSPAAQVSVLNAATDVPGTQRIVNPALAADPATSPKVTRS